MNFICFKIYIFFILFDTFISSNTNIPRTNNNKNNNPKNVTTDITPLGPVPDIITLDYIRELLIHIQLIKDEVIKEKLKKLKLLKKQSKDNKNDKDLKNEIEHLEKELIDTRLLCKDYIKNELEEIKILKDQIVNDKIDQYRWKGDKLIDYELKKLFFQARLKKDKKLYEKYMKKQFQNYVIQEENIKTDGIIQKIILRIRNVFTELKKNIQELEFLFGKYIFGDNYVDIMNTIPQLELSYGKYILIDIFNDIINHILENELSFEEYSSSEYNTEIIKYSPDVELTSDSNFISIYIAKIIKHIAEVILPFEKYYRNYYNKIIKHIPAVELSFGKYLDHKLRKIHNKVFKRKGKSKSKRKSRTFFQVWSAFHDWLEEQAIKYHIGAYTLFFLLISTMAKTFKILTVVCATPASNISSIILGVFISIICIIILIIFFYYVYKLISEYIKSKRE